MKKLFNEYIIMIRIEQKKENSIHTKTRTLKMFSHWIRDLGILHTTVVNIGSWTVL